MEQLTEFDYGIAEYIWKILKTQQPIVWSWGVDPDTVKTIKNGTQFHVQGFLMKGTVKITYDEVMDLFDLELLPDDSTNPRKAILGLYLDQLVSVIDKHVEYCDNYEQRINEEYSLIVIPGFPNNGECVRQRIIPKSGLSPILPFHIIQEKFCVQPVLCSFN